MADHATLPRAFSIELAPFGLIGESTPMRRLFEMIGKVSQSYSPVLIVGETGTGKELVARAVHFAGSRRGQMLVPIDCSALTPTLVETELFGYVKGAFTGADRCKKGLLHVANEGTIFLDEVGELPLFLQAKLLRALQEKEIRPVGSTERIPINGRVIAATNRDLEAGIRDGTFRQDLYFRLNVMQIRMPTLRERRIDIPLLAAHFLEKFWNPRRPVREISDDAIGRLMAYDWPGNVRELENAIEGAVALSASDVLTAASLATVPCWPSVAPAPDPEELVPLEELERRAIFHAIRETRGDKVAAAGLLGIGKTTLYRKLEQYGQQGRQSRVVPASKEELKVQEFLICVLHKCRHLVNLRESEEQGNGPHNLPRDCPQCGHLLSRFCPLCKRLLGVNWQGEIPHCKCCGGELSASEA